MRTSDKPAVLYAALAKAQGEFKRIERSGYNKFNEKPYATLGDIMGAVRPALSANGLAVIQGHYRTEDGRMVLRTRLAHESGETIETDTPMAAGDGKNAMQGIGIAMTYARRYGLAALLGVTADEDDDAEGLPDDKAKKANGRGKLSVHSDAPDPAPHMGRGPSAAQAKKDGAGERFNALKHAADQACEEGSIMTLEELWRANKIEIEGWPESWRREIGDHFRACRQTIEAFGVTA